MRPTARAIALFIAGVPLALFLVVYNPGLWQWSLGYGLLAFIAIAIDFALARCQVQVSAQTPASVQIGETSAVTVTMAAPGSRRETLFDLLCERRPEADGDEIVHARMRPGENALAQFTLAPRRRGRITIDAIWLRWRGPLGLAEFVRRVEVSRSVDVVPNVRAVRGSTLDFFAREAMFGNKVQQEKGEGSEYEALRDYVPGLDSRFIDWKHSARHRKLLCKEFRIERNHPIVLAFDTGHLMLEPVDGLARLDHAINAGLLLAWISLQGGDLVGLYGFDAVLRHYQQPRRGVANFSHLLRGTAALDYHHTETNFTLGLAELNARLKRRALVVLFTEFIDTVTAELLVESMARISRQHVIVFVTLRDAVLHGFSEAPPDRFDDVAKAVVAYDFLRERETVFERLARLGVHCLDVPSRSLPIGLINRYLLIKQRGLI
jgi:uncharacterized protein (DUF58 family)